MKIYFNVTWAKNGLFNAGQRDFTMVWNEGQAIPRKGETVDVSTFIEGEYSSNEIFMHNNTVTNVFDWIESTTGWEVENLKWDYKDDSIMLHILITDRG